MSWITVNVQEGLDDGEQFYLLEAFTRFPDGRKPYPFKSVPLASSVTELKRGLMQPQTVRRAGDWLYKKLRQHPAVKQAIGTALTTGQRAPIYIQLMSDAAEDLPWEALCDRGGRFFALDVRWPVARIASSTLPSPGEYYLERPLRMMAVLSATGVDAGPEWEALYAAIKGAQLPVNLYVLVGESGLKNRIQAITDPLLHKMRVDFVPGTTQSLANQIESFLPNVLHFFCHGSTVEEPELLIATLADHARADGQSSIRLSADSLSMIPNIHHHSWLVVLNCCQGAAMKNRAQSLARSLVTSGFPVVVGMRETITSPDAHLFCCAFYHEAFGTINRFNNSGQRATDVCWAELLHKPRQQLGQSHAGGAINPRAASELKEWTLPVIYVQSARFRLLRAVPDTSKRVELSTLRQMRRELGNTRDIPPGVLEEIERKIAELEDELYPA